MFVRDSYVVDQILSGQLRETIVESIHSKLMEVGQKVNNGEIPIELYYITKVWDNNCSYHFIGLSINSFIDSY